MYQWGIHHEDVLLKIFKFSLAGDAHEWYFSLPPARISSLAEFRVDFNRHCRKFYSSEFIYYNYCEESGDSEKDMVVSYEGCEGVGGYKDEDPKEEEDAWGKFMELIISLTTKLERWEDERFAKDFPTLEEDVLGSPTEEDNEYFIVVEALVFASDKPSISVLNEEVIVEKDCPLFLHEISNDVFTFGIEKKDQEIIPFLQDGGVLCSPSLNDYSVEEQQIPTSYIDDQRRNQLVCDIYESGSELDMQYFKE
jgi:hypothetical protein